jgi:hypothetical protein
MYRLQVNNCTNPTRGGLQFQHIKLSKEELQDSGLHGDVLNYLGGSGYKLIPLAEAQKLLLHMKSSNGMALSPCDESLFEGGGALAWVVDGESLPVAEWA